MSLDKYENFWAKWFSQAEENLQVEIENRTSNIKFKKFNDLLGKYVSSINKKRARVLEVGCGTAINSYMLAVDEKNECYAMDISEQSIESARKIGKHFPQNINLFIGDAQNIYYPDGFFDIIFSQGVMEHFKDYDRFLKEQIRLISDYGYILISVPQKFNPYTIYKHIRIRKGIWEWGWETEYSLPDFKKMARIYDLELLEAIGYGYAFQRDYGLSYIRDLSGKCRRRVPLVRKFNFLTKATETYDSIWMAIEEKLGAYFLVDIAVVLKKKSKG